MTKKEIERMAGLEADNETLDELVTVLEDRTERLRKYLLIVYPKNVVDAMEVEK